MNIADFTEHKEIIANELAVKDFFRYTGSNVVWYVLDFDFNSILIDSKRIKKTVYLDKYYEGKNFNATYGDRRVILLKCKLKK